MNKPNSIYRKTEMQDIMYLVEAYDKGAISKTELRQKMFFYTRRDYYNGLYVGTSININNLLKAIKRFWRKLTNTSRR